jgi:hypothetical protein
VVWSSFKSPDLCPILGSGDFVSMFFLGIVVKKKGANPPLALFRPKKFYRAIKGFYARRRFRGGIFVETDVSMFMVIHLIISYSKKTISKGFLIGLKTIIYSNSSMGVWIDAKLGSRCFLQPRLPHFTSNDISHLPSDGSTSISIAVI